MHAVHKYTSADEHVMKNHKTTTRHFGCMEKACGHPYMVRTAMADSIVVYDQGCKAQESLPL